MVVVDVKLATRVVTSRRKIPVGVNRKTAPT